MAEKPGFHYNDGSADFVDRFKSITGCHTIYTNHVNNSSENIVYEHIGFEGQKNSNGNTNTRNV